MADPDHLTAATWCNPLPVPNLGAGEGRRLFGSLADPTVFRHGGRYYLYASGCQAWVSEDLVHWEYRKVELPVTVVGPSIVEHAGVFYLSGNGGIGMWRSAGPLGPWQRAGDLLDHQGRKVFWADLMFFVDDDGTFYCYHHPGSGVGADGIYVDVLDPESGFTRAKGPSIRCFGYVPAHTWERWGAFHEHADVAWIESPWMTKHGGRYHLQYSACGTEWNGYAVGVYTAKKPAGPFVYDDRSPVLAATGGLLRGPGHHAVVESPGGELRVLYHVLFRNAGKFDRRLALDRAGFDSRGRLVFHGPTETPQWVPRSGSRGDAGLVPVSVDKEMRASSSAPGRSAAYANDHNVRTWWRAARPGPAWLDVDLAASFRVEAVRVIFANDERAGASRTGYRFRVETSPDGAVWAKGTEHESHGDIAYGELPRGRARHVRLAIVSGPPGVSPGVVELTVFGRQ